MRALDSPFFHVNINEKEKIIMPTWTGNELNTELFMLQMEQYMELLLKAPVNSALWNHQNFNFQIPKNVFQWIEDKVNKPAKSHGLKRIAFILGEDVMAQFSTMDVFEETRSVYAPRYYSDPKQALAWVKTKDKEFINPFQKEIDFLIEKNLERGTAKIQIEISLEHLPYYLKQMKDVFSHQKVVHANYQKYMLLTGREREILNYVVDGFTSKQISERLFISLNTVTTHRKNILRKLDCNKVADLARFSVFMRM
ncbi:MAG TPA: helix-turn-helix transcriptional regulator [Chryseosolibacter sp.]|nr:helix-turn-helix transcriptional regulator [Chryseosolibacter sp.]